MIYRFSDFIIDSSVFELRRDGAIVPLEPQAFNLLFHLIKNRGQVVSKDDLMAAVWDGRVVSDTTLSSGIFAIRRAVDDTGEAQNVIKTVPRRGFRFVAELHFDEGDTAPVIPANGGYSPTAPDAAQDSDGELSPGEPKPALTTDRYPAAAIPRLVVLPFKNASSGLDEYFCDGLTEDIISNLTHFREIRVIASGSSFQLKDCVLSLAEIAGKLDVNYVVDGSVRVDGGRLRIAVQLVDAATGVSIWADRYDREMEDIFSVQDAVTHMIVAALGVRMQSAELTRALRKSPRELDAYDCLLHARRYTATLDQKMHFEARELLEKAIELDPNYADAYALLANVYLAEHRFEANPRPEPIERALKMAIKATQLDQQNAYAHCWLAIVHFFRKDSGKFETEIQRALDLNPNDPEILAEAGHYFSYMGEFERGIEYSKKAQALNPLHPGWYHFSFARLHYFQQKYEDMLIDVQRISMPDFYWTHLLDAAALGQLGRDAAGASLERMHDLNPGMSVAAEMRKWNLAQRDFDHIMEGLRKAGLKEKH